MLRILLVHSQNNKQLFLKEQPRKSYAAPAIAARELDSSAGAKYDVQLGARRGDMP